MRARPPHGLAAPPPMPSAPPSAPASGFVPRGTTAMRELRLPTPPPTPLFQPSEHAPMTLSPHIVDGPDFDGEHVDTAVLTLSPEYLARLRSIAPARRASKSPYVVMLAILTVAAALAGHAPTREFLMSRVHDLVAAQAASSSAAGSEPARSGKTVDGTVHDDPAVNGAVAAARPTPLSAQPPGSTSALGAVQGNDPEVVALPPTEVPATTAPRNAAMRKIHANNRNRSHRVTPSGH